MTLCYRVIHDTGGTSPNRFVADRDVTDIPCPAITCGIGGMNSCHFHVELRDVKLTERKLEDKPPYRVPSMEEIAAAPQNGLVVADLFSGAGGSCTGFRMAGYRVAYANEFVPAAQASYNANKADDCYLDCRDVKTVQAQEILDRIGMESGQLDVMSGSPPCQAFSTAGKRHKGWGHEKTYEHGAKQCNERLFDEYIRLLRGLMPKTFVAENVSGLVKGTAKGMFLEILAALKASGYRVKCKVLDAQWLGVPQMRQRTIFVGVREDLGLDPVHPKPLGYRYSVRDALPWIGEIRQSNAYGEGDRFTTDGPCLTVAKDGLGAKRRERVTVEAETDISRYAIGKEWDKLKPGEQSAKYFSCVKTDAERPCNSIMASSGSFPSAAQPLHPTEKRKFTIAELKRICAFPDTFVLLGSYSQQWERLGNSVPPVMMFHVARTIADEIFQQRSGGFRYDVANGWMPA